MTHAYPENHYNQNSEHIFHPQVSLHPLVILSSVLFGLCPQVTTELAVTVDMFIFSRFFLYKWSHLVCTFFVWLLWRLMLFHVSVVYCFFLFWVVFHCINILQFVYSFTCLWKFVFLFLGYFKENGMNIWVQVFMWAYIFISLQ